MRTTVNLDDEVYELAMLRAKGQGTTLGAALSAFVREARDTRTNAALEDDAIPAGLVRGPNGMLMFAARKDGSVLTTEMVKKALAEMDDEEDERKWFPAGRQRTRRAV